MAGAGMCAVSAGDIFPLRYRQSAAQLAGTGGRICTGGIGIRFNDEHSPDARLIDMLIRA